MSIVESRSINNAKQDRLWTIRKDEFILVPSQVVLEATMLRGDAFQMERRAEALPIARLVGIVILFMTGVSAALIALTP
ncbi:hypothetical protein [Enterovirga sp.]|uniref:hypothetical protein n=1 Tax=Enterovirga sp. TaxID=2026350 RepID=UPI002CEEE978|nr:hypothetical protein [Enterovirga sp.]HMO28197.1 hypothetical protein [Enterovirga sp.]